MYVVDVSPQWHQLLSVYVGDSVVFDSQAAALLQFLCWSLICDVALNVLSSF